MSALKVAGASAIADLVSLHPEIWAAVTFREGELDIALALLAAEFEGVDPPRDSVMIRARGPIELIDAVLTRSADTVFLIVGLEKWSSDDAMILDGKRNALEGRTVLFCTNDDGLTKLAEFAPNVYSWLGGQCLRYDASEGVMNVEERLVSLRTHYALSDADVEQLAREGKLPAEPAFVEWLVLIGRGDLIGS
ncbi:MAG TPA: hypothetical protein VGM88_15835 [Kofleriaceae bacterium]